jgi:hypothetical protein
MSVQLVKLGREQIIVAADSRVTARRDITGADYVKLFQAGERSLVSITGLIHLPRRWPWEREELIPDCVSRLCANPYLADRPLAFLGALQDYLYARLVRLFKKQSKFTCVPSDSVFSGFYISCQPDGALDFLELQFPLEDHNVIPELGLPSIVVHIKEQIPRPFMFNVGPTFLIESQLPLVDPGGPDDQIRAAINRTIAAAQAADETCRAEIGGPINMAAIDAHGFRWLLPV